MADHTPPLMTEDQFNKSIKNWTVTTRRKIVSNVNTKTKHTAPEWKKRTSKKLSQSLSYRFRTDYGSISLITYSFERHGVFLHYGVGRGYVRTGNGIMRGRKLSEDEFTAYRKKRIPG